MANTSTISLNTYSKKQLVLPPKTAFYRKLAPIAWSDITIGVAINCSQPAEVDHPNSFITTPSGGFFPPYVNTRSLLTIGLRSSTNIAAFPGEAGVRFAGLGQISSTHITTPVASSVVGNGGYSSCGVHPLVSTNTVFSGARVGLDHFGLNGNANAVALLVFRLVKTSTQIAIGYKGFQIGTTALPSTIAAFLNEVSTNNPSSLEILSSVDDPLQPLDTFWAYFPWVGISMKLNKLAIIYNA